MFGLVACLFMGAQLLMAQTQLTGDNLTKWRDPLPTPGKLTGTNLTIGMYQVQQYIHKDFEPGQPLGGTTGLKTTFWGYGTSQATAFVTGVAVLVMALRPEFSISDVKKYILRTGDEYPTLLSKTGSAKLLNSYKALTNLDKGVAANGSTTVNTERTRAFTSGDTSKELSHSGLSTNQERDPAEEIGSFGKSLINAIGGPAARERAGASEPVPSSSAKDPNIKD